MDEVVAANIALEKAKRQLAQAVSDARAHGRTWNDIGEALGMSKQAAYKRFGRPTDPSTGAPVEARGVSDAAELTEQAFRCIAGGDHDRLASLMHPRAAQELPPARIATVWQSVLAEVGSLGGFTDTHVELPGGDRLDGDERVLGTVVGVTTLECEAGQMHGRVAVGEDSRIVGILIVPVEHGPLPF